MSWVRRESRGRRTGRIDLEAVGMMGGSAKGKPMVVPSAVASYAAWTIPMLLVILRHSPNLSKTPVPADWRPCDKAVGGNCRLLIPKIVHQTYKTDKLPDAWAHAPAQWRKTMPDWEYMFWTDEKNRELIATHFPWFLEQYDAYPNNIQRADAVRYFILYHYGGVYADLDVEPVRSIEPMLMNSVAMLSETPNIGLTNAFMSSEKHSDFFNYIMHELTPHRHPFLGKFSRHWEILQSTGPTFVWKIYNEYMQLTNRPDREEVDRMPAWVWGKCKICDKKCAPLDGAYFRHTVGDSWHNWDSFLFTYVIFCHVEAILLLLTATILFAALRVPTNQQLSVFYVVSFLVLML